MPEKKKASHGYKKKLLYGQLDGEPRRRLRKLTAAGKAISAQVRAAHPHVKSEAYMRKLIMNEVHRPQREANKLAQQVELERTQLEEKKLKERLLNDPRYTRAAYKATYKETIPSFP